MYHMQGGTYYHKNIFNYSQCNFSFLKKFNNDFKDLIESEYPEITKQENPIFLSTLIIQ